MYSLAICQIPMDANTKVRLAEYCNRSADIVIDESNGTYIIGQFQEYRLSMLIKFVVSEMRGKIMITGVN